MSKGEATRQAVLDQAVEVARQVGLGGLTIGRLAEQAHMSKSGLFAHFRSKEALQLAVLEHARADFEAHVARPTLKAPRGEARLRALFDHWVRWIGLPGGCPFVAAATEFDDQPGPVRDRVVHDLRDLFDMINTIFRTGITEGQFRADADPEQFTQDFYGVILGYHYVRRLFGDEQAEQRARRALDALIEQARRPA
ncbi:MAG: TetR/AcrR family transcriptional regulator [Micromonosporaceae bacterium]|nr:TetR/AcrR family transcriptional regulator [Micromonosporaceae bacterium]